MLKAGDIVTILAWGLELSERKPGQICIDGKTLRKAFSKGGALHLVSAFAVENGMTIGSKDSEGKARKSLRLKIF